MKRLLFTLALLLTGLAVQQAHAARIPVGNAEKLEKVADLPDTEDYQLKDGKYVDLGIKFKVFTIAWIPIYTTEDPQLVGYAGGDTYYDIPKEELTNILAANKLEEKKLLKLSFWNAWGGKLVIGVLLLIIIYGMLPSRKKEREVTPQSV